MVFTAVLTPAEEATTPNAIPLAGVFWNQEAGFVAFNPETGTTTQGETVQQAVENLKEATTLYLEEFPMKAPVKPSEITFEVVLSRFQN